MQAEGNQTHNRISSPLSLGTHQTLDSASERRVRRLGLRTPGLDLRQCRSISNSLTARQVSKPPPLPLLSLPTCTSVLQSLGGACPYVRAIAPSTCSVSMTCKTSPSEAEVPLGAASSCGGHGSPRGPSHRLIKAGGRAEGFAEAKDCLLLPKTHNL